MEGNGRLIFFVMKNFVDSDSMCMRHDIFIFSLCIEFSGMLFEGYGFNRFYFLHIEGLALIIEFLILCERLSQSSLIVETNFL